MNSDFSVCPSYPGAVIVPSSVDDGTLVKAARFRQGGRFPVLCYCHHRNGRVRPNRHGRGSSLFASLLVYYPFISYDLALLAWLHTASFSHSHTHTLTHTQVPGGRKNSMSRSKVRSTVLKVLVRYSGSCFENSVMFRLRCLSLFFLNMKAVVPPYLNVEVGA